MKPTAANSVADEPALRDRDRRGLHRAGLVAGLDHRAQRALEVGRLRRRQPGGLAPAADAALDGAEQPARALRGIQDGRQQERRRRLAVRARDADEVELAARVAVERGGQPRHALARVVAQDLRHAEVGQLALDEQRHGAVRDRGGREVVAVGVGSGQAAEQRPRPAALRAVGDVDDVDAGRRAGHTRGDARVRAQRGELHGG